MLKIFKNLKIKKGFTLLETLVAILILAMSISAAMTVIQNSLQFSFFARDRMAAYFLAQEAIEMIKNKRDENGIKNYLADPSVHWLDGIANWATVTGSCDQNRGCGPDSFNDNIVSCLSNNNCKLYKDGNGIFVYSSGGGVTETKFTRKVNMEQVSGSPDEAKVTVTISWPGRSFTITEYISNWHPLSNCLSCP